MNKVRRLGGLGGLWLLVSLSACTPQLVQLLQTPDAPVMGQSVAWVRSLHVHKQRVSVRDQYGKRQYVPLVAVWGYRTQSGEQYRFIEGDAYKVVQRGPLWVYQTREWLVDVAWETYYFSHQPTSGVFLLSKHTCLAVFQSDSCMHTLVSQMKTQQLITVDKKGLYGLNAIYQHCYPVESPQPPAVTSKSN